MSGLRSYRGPYIPVAGTIGFILSAGMLSHQLKQHVIDGEKTIDQEKKDHEKAELEVREVYAVMSSSAQEKARPKMQDREPPSTSETPLNNMA